MHMVMFAGGPDAERVAIELGLKIALILFLRIGLDAARVHHRHHRDLARRIAIDGDRSIDFFDIEMSQSRGGPFFLETRGVLFERHAASHERDRQKRIDGSAVSVHRSPLLVLRYVGLRDSWM